MTLIYKVVGRGTRQMAAMAARPQAGPADRAGQRLFTWKTPGNTALVIGGGVGVPPLYGLCKRLVQQGKRASAVLGFGNTGTGLLPRGIRRAGLSGLSGHRGRQSGHQGLCHRCDGPAGLRLLFCLRPHADAAGRACTSGRRGQLSFEERMGCGFGACMGCSCETLVGTKRICVDGPVMRSEEVKF